MPWAYIIAGIHSFPSLLTHNAFSVLITTAVAHLICVSLLGCPLVVANLWDVTDKDIDRFSDALIDHCTRLLPGIDTEEGGGEDSNDDGPPPDSISAAVPLAREVCKLKYLMGASPVVYGLPL